MRLRRARMVSGDTPAAAAESLHANPWAMRRTSARSAGVRFVPSRNLVANGVRISISIWAIGVVPFSSRCRPGWGQFYVAPGGASSPVSADRQSVVFLPRPSGLSPAPCTITTPRLVATPSGPRQVVFDQVDGTTALPRRRSGCAEDPFGAIYHPLEVHFNTPKRDLIVW